MSIQSDQVADVCIADVIGPKYIDDQQLDHQRVEVCRRVDCARKGVMIDCSMIEVATMDVVKFLMKVRVHARRQDKRVALFGVSESLQATIAQCGLSSELRPDRDAISAKQFVSGRSKTSLWGRVGARFGLGNAASA